MATTDFAPEETTKKIIIEKGHYLRVGKTDLFIYLFSIKSEVKWDRDLPAPSLISDEELGL